MYFDLNTQLENNGFLVIPMEYYKSKPHYPKYSHLNRNAFPTSDEKSKWRKDFGDESNVIFIGDVCPAIDFDIENIEIAKQMEDFIRSKFGEMRNKNLFFRYGTRPKFLVPFQRKGEYRKLHSCKYTNDDGEVAQIEVMGTGATYTYYGTHRKTKQPYVEENNKGRKLKDVTIKSLPKLSKKDIVEIFDKFNELINESNEWTMIQSSSKLSKTSEVKDEIQLEPDAYSDDELKEMLLAIPYLGYDDWTSIGMALHNRFEGKSKGLGFWVDYSQAQCPDAFDRSEIEYKWSTFTNDGDSCITASFITNKYFSLFGADSEIETIQLCKTIPEAIDRFYQIANTSEIFDSNLAGLSSSDSVSIISRITKKAFLDTYSHIQIERDTIKNGEIKTISKSLAEWWCLQIARKTVQGVIFNPKKEKLFHSNIGNKQALFGNTFVSQQHTITTNKNLIHHFTSHIEYLIPNEKERNWFIQWMAWIVRYKGERCKVTPLLINTEHGSGRGWLVKLIEEMLGAWNCSRPKIDEIDGNFHNFMIDKLLVSVEEVYQNKGRYEIADNLKSILDADKFHGNEKYGLMQERTKWCNFFFMSNRLDALTLEDDDRRLNVFFSRTERKSQIYYDNLYNLLETDEFKNQIFTYLTQTVDMTGFNPKGRSMDTEGRRILLRANKNEVDIILDNFVSYVLQSGLYLIDQDTIGEILEEYALPNSMIKTSIITHKMNELMKSPHDFIKINGLRKRVWIYKSIPCNEEEQYNNLNLIKQKFIKASPSNVNLFESTDVIDTVPKVRYETTGFDL